MRSILAIALIAASASASVTHVVPQAAALPARMGIPYGSKEIGSPQMTITKPASADHLPKHATKSKSVKDDDKYDDEDCEEEHDGDQDEDCEDGLESSIDDEDCEDGDGVDDNINTSGEPLESLDFTQSGSIGAVENKAISPEIPENHKIGIVSGAATNSASVVAVVGAAAISFMIL